MQNDFAVILEELRQFDARLAAKPMLVVASKIDVMQDRQRLETLQELCAARGLPLYPISAHSGAGLERLKLALAEKLEQLRAADPTGAQTRDPTATPTKPSPDPVVSSS